MTEGLLFPRLQYASSGFQGAVNTNLLFGLKGSKVTAGRTFTERMMPHLHSLAVEMLSNRDYAYLHTVAELLAGLNGGGWERLGDDERYRFLEQMRVDFHPRGMGDYTYGMNKDYQAIMELIDAEWRRIPTKN